MLIDDTIIEIFLAIITIGIGIVAELLRRILNCMGVYSKHLTVLETKIALCPNCPKEEK